MSIMNFQRSRLLRATAYLTLVSMLAGCIPANSKPGASTSDDSTLSTTLGGFQNSANGLLDSLGGIGDMAQSAGDAVGIKVPGTKKGSELRTWSEADKAGAERAKAIFSGESADGLPVYNPSKPGEQARYKEAIKRLVAKYNGRKDLSPTEMMEVAKVVVPLARFISQSRTYRESKKAGVKVEKNPKGNSSVVIPAGMTVEIAMLTYCNDHGLPAPWSGEKLHFRNSRDYMPEELFPIYEGLHTVAASNPGAHYKTQGLVWWLRDTPCKTEALSDAEKQLLVAADPNAMTILQSYCMKQKLKEHAASFAKQYAPAGAADALNQYQGYMAQAESVSQKANAFLAADLTDPVQVLQLAQTAGLTKKLGQNNLLDNKYLKQALPLLKKSGFVEALVPGTAEDKSIAASLAAMEALGEEVGKTAGKDQGSLANYSDLGNGMYAENIHSGGANNTAVRITNTGTEPQTVVGSDFVLSTVNDPASGRNSYTPTQRLSVGPMIPVKVYPSNPLAEKIFSEKFEKVASDTLKELIGVDFQLMEPKPASDEPKKDCSLIEQIKNVNIGDLGIGTIADVVEATPIVSNILAAYNLISGKNWNTGEELGLSGYIDSAINLVSPPGAGTLKKIGMLTGKAGYRFGRKALANIRRSSEYKAYVKATGKTGFVNDKRNEIKEGVGMTYDIATGDICNAASKAVSMIGTHGCKAQKCELAASAISSTFEYNNENPPERDGVSFLPETPKLLDDIGAGLGKGTDLLKGLLN